MAETLIYTVLVIISLLAIMFIFYRFLHKKWRCTEGSCEQDIDGDYASKSECLDACKQKQAMMKEEENDAWACTNGYQCIKSEQGDYATEEACQKNCQQPTNYYTQYYPQSLYYPRRPTYWNYRGRGGRGGRGRRRHGRL
jgi:hypothetical protein